MGIVLAIALGVSSVVSTILYKKDSNDNGKSFFHDNTVERTISFERNALESNIKHKQAKLEKLDNILDEK